MSQIICANPGDLHWLNSVSPDIYSSYHEIVIWPLFLKNKQPMFDLVWFGIGELWSWKVIASSFSAFVDELAKAFICS